MIQKVRDFFDHLCLGILQAISVAADAAERLAARLRAFFGRLFPRA